MGVIRSIWTPASTDFDDWDGDVDKERTVLADRDAGIVDEEQFAILLDTGGETVKVGVLKAEGGGVEAEGVVERKIDGTRNDLFSKGFGGGVGKADIEQADGDGDTLRNLAAGLEGDFTGQGGCLDFGAIDGFDSFGAELRKDVAESGAEVAGGHAEGAELAFFRESAADGQDASGGGFGHDAVVGEINFWNLAGDLPVLPDAGEVGGIRDDA